MPAAAVKFGPCIQGGCFGFNIMKYFSFVQSLQWPLVGLKALFLAKIVQSTVWGGFGSFQVPNMLAKCCVICVLVFEG